MIRFGNRDPAGTSNNLPVPSSPLRRVVQMGSPLFTRRKSNYDLYGSLDSDEDGSIPFKCPEPTSTDKKNTFKDPGKKIASVTESPKSIIKDPGLVSLQDSIEKVLRSSLDGGDDASISVSDCVHNQSQGPSGSTSASDLTKVDILYQLMSHGSKSDSNLPSSKLDSPTTSPRVVRRRRTLSHQLSPQKKATSTASKGARLCASSSVLSTPRRRSMEVCGSTESKTTELNQKTTKQLGRHSSHEILRDNGKSKSKSEERLSTTSSHEHISGKSKRRSQLSRRARRVPSKTNRGSQLSTLHETEPSTVPKTSPKVSPRVSPTVQPKRRSSLHISLYDSSSDKKGSVQSMARIPDLEKTDNASTQSTEGKVLTVTPYEPDYAVRRLSSGSDHAVWISSSSGHNRHLEVDFSQH